MQYTTGRRVWVAGLVIALMASACSNTESNGRTSASAPTEGGSAGSRAEAGSGTPSVTSMRVVPKTSGNGSVLTAGMPATPRMPATPGALGQGGVAGVMPGAAAGNGALAMGQSGAGSVAPSMATPTERNGKQPKLPAAPATCPTIETGTITVMGQEVQTWVGPKKGPMVFYWHGTGSRAGEVVGGLGPGLSEIMSQGGVVASFTTTTQMGRTTGNGVWYTSDFEMADQVLACADQQGLVDTQRIYSAGCSAGGIHTSTMAYARSGYLAASAPNSGGIVFPTAPQDASHLPFQISSHGAREKDLVRAGDANAMIDIYFADITANNNKDLVAKGGFAVNCDHGGEHCANPPALTAAMWLFLKSHTFDTATSPFAAGLPADFPAYCQIVR